MKTLETPQQVIQSRIDLITLDMRDGKEDLMKGLKRCAKLREIKDTYEKHE